VWLASLDPVAAGEQGGTRPVLVISTLTFNAWPVRLVVVVPITSRERGFAHHVPIVGGGLDQASFAMPEYVRSVSQRRLRRLLGIAPGEVVTAVDEWLRRITAL